VLLVAILVTREQQLRLIPAGGIIGADGNARIGVVERVSCEEVAVARRGTPG
jgi:hypothetical protein